MYILKELLEGMIYKVQKGKTDIEVSDISYNTEEIKPDSVYVCINGAKTDSHDLVHDAVRRGASAIIAERSVDMSVNAAVIIVDDTREALAVMSANYYDIRQKIKDSGIILIGITGTKGKTTISYMIDAILSGAGFRTGVIGSIGIKYSGRQIECVNTTPESYILMKTLDDMIKHGVQAVIMEVSSQGLKQKRVHGLTFDYGIFTNISEDHIGVNEHPDMDDYIYSKSLLFGSCRHAIVNADDPACSRILEGNRCDDITCYGIEGDLTCAECCFATDIRLMIVEESLGVRFDVHLSKGNNEPYTVLMRLPGEYNVYNALAAIAVCDRVMYCDEDETRANVMIAALRDIKINGRTQQIDSGKGFRIIIDHAHNELSLAALLKTLRMYDPKRIICVFGCGGNRSRVRRYNMGRIAALYADITVLTSDNPRYEDPAQIVEDIETGLLHILSKKDRINNNNVCGDENGRYVIIEDRTEAICYAIDTACEGDMIVIAGKGHEAWQEIQGRKIAYNDAETVMDILTGGNNV